MRRHTLVLALVALLSVTGLATAQTAFPPELDGDGAVQGAVGLEFKPVEHFQLPWSIPGPDPATAWLTNIYTQVLPPFDLMVEQICLTLNGECWLPPAYPELGFPWRADIGSYCLTRDLQGGDMSIDCYTYQGDTWSHYIGKLEFTGHPPQWYDWEWYILDVANLVTAQRPVPSITPLSTD